MHKRYYVSPAKLLLTSASAQTGRDTMLIQP